MRNVRPGFRWVAPHTSHLTPHTSHTTCDMLAPAFQRGDRLHAQFQCSPAHLLCTRLCCLCAAAGACCQACCMRASTSWCSEARPGGRCTTSEHGCDRGSGTTAHRSSPALLSAAWRSHLHATPPPVRRCCRKDNEALLPAKQATPIAYPKPDGKLTFDLPTSLYRSGAGATCAARAATAQAQAAELMTHL